MPPHWSEWKGNMMAKMESSVERILELEGRMDKLEEKVSDVIAKITVPLFIVGMAGPIVGAIIVAVVTRTLK